ncbi:sporulation protein [Paenibacillus ginsengarvi]|uniref:Sporulation protein n=1 Tax=Paenibacillus ginsengarvi TaxID=400777 RepID=A0A3B0CU28_9BACL|nr:sporulation protein [Paenibacillus ginsengarvi]RKN86567.1 sporulation protein [Paenibacillus ginsengarvi]
MRLWTFHARSREYTAALAVLTALLVLSILLFPERAFKSSLGGLTIWWNIVFPSLLPFLMLGELMNGFGATRAIGTLLEPLARLLFRFPGIGGWAIALGAVAGMPTGAEMAGKLRRDGLVSREEGERILVVSHVASPFFVLTVIGAGFLHSAETGAIIAIVHYASAIGTGLLLRLFQRDTRPAIGNPAARSSSTAVNNKRTLLFRALADMHRARLEDGRSFGKLLGDSVSGSIQTLMMIGGTMIVFSVLLGVIETAGVVRAAAGLASLTFPETTAAADSVRSFLSGLLELHIGSNRLSQIPLSGASIAALIAAGLAWSGLAVHVQVKTAIRHTDLRYRVFLLTRLVQAGLSVLLTFATWQPLSAWFRRAEPSFFQPSAAAAESGVSLWTGWLTAAPYQIMGLGTVLLIGIGLSVVVSIWQRTGKWAD